MFVQFCRGHVTSASEALDLLDRWQREQRASATGFLGATAGATDDGELVLLARFASPEDAERNAARPQQGNWWAEFEKRFDGPIEVHDCTDVTTFLGGGHDEAGFVQVIVSPAAAPVTSEAVATSTERAVREHRPDVLGGFAATAEDGTVVEAVYFSSEEEARRGEARPWPEDVAAAMEAVAHDLGEPVYLDLRAPRFV